MESKAQLKLRPLFAESSSVCMLPEVSVSQQRRAVMSAEALAARTDVLALLEVLRGAGARILPEVWHRVTSRYVIQSTPDPADVIMRPGDAPSTGRSEKSSGKAERQW